MNRTRASEQLREKLAGHGAQERFRKQFNDDLPEAERVDAPTVSRWVNGKTRPTLEQVLRIAALEKVGIELWTESAEVDPEEPDATRSRHAS